MCKTRFTTYLNWSHDLECVTISLYFIYVLSNIYHGFFGSLQTPVVLMILKKSVTELRQWQDRVCLHQWQKLGQNKTILLIFPKYQCWHSLNLVVWSQLFACKAKFKIRDYYYVLVTLPLLSTLQAKTRTYDTYFWLYISNYIQRLE